MEAAWGCGGLSWNVWTLRGAGLKAVWIDLGLSGAVLARLGAIWGRPGADLEPAWSCLDADKAARTNKKKEADFMSRVAVRRVGRP